MVVRNSSSLPDYASVPKLGIFTPQKGNISLSLAIIDPPVT